MQRFAVVNLVRKLALFVLLLLLATLGEVHSQSGGGNSSSDSQCALPPSDYKSKIGMVTAPPPKMQDAADILDHPIYYDFNRCRDESGAGYNTNSSDCTRWGFPDERSNSIKTHITSRIPYVGSDSATALTGSGNFLGTELTLPPSVPSAGLLLTPWKSGYSLDISLSFGMRRPFWFNCSSCGKKDSNGNEECPCAIGIKSVVSLSTRCSMADNTPPTPTWHQAPQEVLCGDTNRNTGIGVRSCWNRVSATIPWEEIRGCRKMEVLVSESPSYHDFIGQRNFSPSLHCTVGQAGSVCCDKPPPNSTLCWGISGDGVIANTSYGIDNISIRPRGGNDVSFSCSSFEANGGENIPCRLDNRKSSDPATSLWGNLFWRLEELPEGATPIKIGEAQNLSALRFPNKAGFYKLGIIFRSKEGDYGASRKSANFWVWAGQMKAPSVAFMTTSKAILFPPKISECFSNPVKDFEIRRVLKASDKAKGGDRLFQMSAGGFKTIGFVDSRLTPEQTAGQNISYAVIPIYRDGRKGQISQWANPKPPVSANISVTLDFPSLASAECPSNFSVLSEAIGKTSTSQTIGGKKPSVLVSGLTVLRASGTQSDSHLLGFGEGTSQAPSPDFKQPSATMTPDSDPTSMALRYNNFVSGQIKLIQNPATPADAQASYSPRQTFWVLTEPLASADFTYEQFIAATVRLEEDQPAMDVLDVQKCNRQVNQANQINQTICASSKPIPHIGITLPVSSPKSARLTETASVIFPPTENPNCGRRAQSYTIFRRITPNAAHRARQIGQMGADEMEANGFFDTTLTIGMRPLYAVQPVYNDGTTGALSVWDETTWTPGQFDLHLAGGPIPGTTHHSPFYVQFFPQSQESRQDNEDLTVRILGGESTPVRPNGLGFTTDRRALSESDGPYYSRMVRIKYDDPQWQTFASGGMQMISPNANGDERYSPLKAGDIKPAHLPETQLFWVVAGDLTKPALTLKNVHAALKYFEGREGLEKDVYQPLPANGRPENLQPIIDLTQCRFDFGRGNLFHCTSHGSLNVPVLAVSLPNAFLPDILAFYEDFFGFLLDNPQAGNIWQSWGRQNFSLLHPNFQPDVLFLSQTPVNGYMRASLTMDSANLLIFDHTPGNNLLRPGAGTISQWDEAFAKIFETKFLPTRTHNIPEDISTGLVGIRNRGYAALKRTYVENYNIPFNLADFLGSAEGGEKFIALYKQGLECENYIGNMWPGEIYFRCSWTQDPNNPLNCTPPMQCEETDFDHYRKKFDGYDYNGQHVEGYMERLRHYAQNNLPPNFQRRPQLDAVIAKLSDIEANRKLLFTNDRETGATASRTGEIKINNCMCSFHSADHNNALGVFLHEGVHEVHAEKIWNALQNQSTLNNPVEFDRADMRYRIWTEFRAFRFEKCVLKLPQCNLSNRDFMQQEFFDDPQGRNLYVATWEGAEMCTQNHDGVNKIPCTNVEDLDWLPFEGTTEVCDPIRNLKGSACPPELQGLP